VLDALSQTPVAPARRALEVTQHRRLEKEFLRELGVPVAPFVAIEALADIEAAAHMPFPAILKTQTGGYDGKGQERVASWDDLEGSWGSLSRRPTVLEQRLDLVREFSVIAVRDHAGQVRIWAPVEN